MRKEDLMMKFRKNQNKEKQIPKEKKPRVYKVNPHKKVVIALWVLLGLSFSFAIFKHFTAIDTHTIHETTIIEKEYVDTHHVENFVENKSSVIVMLACPMIYCKFFGFMFFCASCVQ